MGLLEWLLPNKWRKVLDRKSFIPAMHDLKDLINECERIERNEVPFNRDEDDDSDNNNKKQKSQVRKKQKQQQKNGREQNEPAADRNGRAHGRAGRFKFNCSECGNNPTHNTERCFK